MKKRSLLENQKLKRIFNRYLENRCTAEEVEQLVRHFHTDKVFYLRQLIQEELEQPEVPGDHQKLQDAANEVFTRIKKQLNTPEKSWLNPYFQLHYWAKLSVAATLIIASAMVIYFSISSQDAGRIQLPAKYTNDLAPGQNKALLTLENGQSVVLLDKGKIYPLSQVEGNEKPVLNKLETPNGGQYQLRLADGTKVWMNSASKLTYPTAFSTSGRRIVELSGEAYFEVAHRQSQPFIVKTDQQEIEVLGTQFNVKAYHNEADHETTLLKGSIKVSGLNNSKILIPGQQAQTSTNSAEINLLSIVDTGMAVAWKEGVFHFDNTDIEKVMQQVTRWYNAEVQYEGEKPDIRFTGVVLKSNNLSNLLDVLQLAGKVKFNIVGNKIIVKNKN